MRANRAATLTPRVAVSALLLVSPSPPQPVGAPAGAAYLVLDLPSRRPVAASRVDLIDTAVIPGSVVKIAAAIAALESGTITPATRIVCSRAVTVNGQRLVCSHPDLGRPMSVSEALGHSCNAFFATVASRLPRRALDDALVALGLPPAAPDVPLAAEALGLDGIRATPRALLNALLRLVDDSSAVRLAAPTRSVVIEGLREAARHGMAAALAREGIEGLAKTGTARMPGGGYHGLVVAVSPASRPSRAIVVLAPGGAGMDAASIAAGLLRETKRPTPASAAARSATSANRVRLGVTRPGRQPQVLDMDLEEYVARVVAGERAPDSDGAALEALAVAARTYAAANRGRHRTDWFDLCDLTHCQVAATATRATTRAAARTRGRLLLHNGKPAELFYSAWCGGRSEIPSAVWPGASDPPFLVSRDDPACQALPGWRADVTAEDLARALRSAGLQGSVLRDLRVAERTASGRVARLKLSGLVPDELSGQAFRTAVGRTLGWQHLKSTWFDVTRTARGYRFDGRGSGHGVGLCVVGASLMAKSGRPAEKILATYFPGLEVAAPSPSAQSASRAQARPDANGPGARGVSVVLPVEEYAQRWLLEEMAQRTMDDLARRIGVARPESVRLRFHPTVGSYQRAAGQPWWTAGATRGTTIDLIPLSALRGRGLLESTLRHELAHVLTEPLLAGRPLWVREGAAIYFSGDQHDTLAHAAACPSDGELRKPVSAAAMRDAYARALTCFARELKPGARWSDVGKSPGAGSTRRPAWPPGFVRYRTAGHEPRAFMRPRASFPQASIGVRR